MFLAALPPPVYDAVKLHISLSETHRIAMNDRGSIVGTHLNAAGKPEGFVYLEGRLIPVLGDTPWTAGINAHDEAVFMGNGGVIVWKKGRATTVVRAKVGSQAGAAGIANDGHVVGTCRDVNLADGVYSVFFYPARKNNPFRGMRCGTVRINNMGQLVIAHEAEPPDGHPHMYLWTQGKMTEIQTANPHAVPEVMDFNDQGVVVGEASVRNLGTMGSDVAYSWRDGKYSELPVFTPNRYAVSKAAAINNLGQIVGYCNWLPDSGGDAGVGPQEVAALWMDDHIYDLNELLSSKEHLNLLEALAINNKGQILVIGQPNRQRAIEVFLLTPRS